MDDWVRNTHSYFLEFGLLSCKIEQIPATPKKPFILFMFVRVT